MEKKAKRTNLGLKKRTLRQLDDADAKGVQGGGRKDDEASTLSWKLTTWGR